MLRVLLTNDDGFQAEGLRELAACLAPRCEMLVVAPSGPQGAVSHSVTLHKPVRLNPLRDYVRGADPAHFSAFSCSGTPADCVMLGARHLWQDNPPHLVLSGINNGENVAQDISYSGTVGGALEGVCCNVPSLALSAVSYDPQSAADNARAADLVISLLLYDRIFAHQRELAEAWRGNGHADTNQPWPLPAADTGEGVDSYPAPAQWWPADLGGLPCLNINMPALPIEGYRGVLWTAAGHREYHDVVKAEVDPRGRKYYWVAGDKVLLDDEHAGTDTHAIANGYVTVTPIGYDRTDRVGLSRLRDWWMERSRL
jgi:5'-nucleotidase